MNWRTVNDWMSWVSLGRLRNSFVSKTLTALSVTSLALANAAQQLQTVGVDLGSLRIVFWGGLIFLAGYLLYAVTVPSEFRRSGEVDEIVGRMAGLADWTFYKSRQDLAAMLLAEQRQNGLLRATEGAFVFLSMQIEAARTVTERDAWESSAKSLYHADLNLRQYARPFARATVAVLLAAGGLCLISPTLENGLLAVWKAALG